MVIPTDETAAFESKEERLSAVEVRETQSSAPEAGADRPRDPGADRPQDPAVGSVQRVRGRLAELDELPVERHVEVYEDLHAQLTAALRAVDSATNPRQGG